MASIDAVLDAVRRHYEDGLAEARSQVTAELNQMLRRLRQYSTEQEFTRAVVDGACLFAQSAAFFSVENGSLVLRAEKGLNLSGGLRFPASERRAFAQAAEAKEVVIALRTASEVGADLAANERAIVVPVQNSERVSGILFASGATDVESIELVASLASLVLSRKQKQSGLAELSGASGSSARTANFPPWGALSEEQQNLHWRAQRFARVKVSEWLLSKPEAGRAGLEQNDIYLFLKKEIDAAREAFRNQFMGDRSMVDYLHVELVSVAAEGDERKLGAEYPGPLV